MPDKSPHCLIRVDGSESIGTGHIMRCLALANELKKMGKKVSFLLALCPEPLKEIIGKQGHAVLLLPETIDSGSNADASYTVRLAKEQGMAYAVVDGYHFSAAYQRLLKDAKLELLYIDDLAHCDYYSADIVLNQSPAASATLYINKAPDTKLLLGLDYVLIRQEFLRYKQTQPPSDVLPMSQNILVTMGGSDIDNVTAVVMEALSMAPNDLNLRVTIVIGAGNKHATEIQTLADKLSSACSHSFRTHVNVQDMPAIIGGSDLVISAGGTTVWETAYLARPAAVIITADNQRQGMEYFANQEAVSLLGWQQALQSYSLAETLVHIIKDPEKRKQLAKKAGSVIDGQGAKRVAKRLCN